MYQRIPANCGISVPAAFVRRNGNLGDANK
jgi:hypothetical protein